MSSCVVAQLRASHRKDHLELAMTVRKEQYEDGGASGKGAIIPLRWRRRICAEAVQCALSE